MNELPADHDPPGKRRRRWPIAALVLAIVTTAACWWARPEVDPRFVGKWEGWNQSLPPIFMMFDLQPDGTGTYKAKYWEDIDYTILATRDPRSLTWWVNGDEIHYQLTSPEPDTLQRFWHALARKFNRSSLASYRVVSVDSQQLVLRYLKLVDQNDARQDLKLKRVP